MNADTTGFYKEKVPSGYKKAKLQNFTPEAMELLQSLYSHVGPDSQLSKLASGDQSAFAELEAPALQQFSGLQGNLASRFSGMGSFGARRSSGFQNTANQAASDFAQQLQSNRLNLRSQALKELFDMSHSLMNEQPYENRLIKKDNGEDWGEIAGKTFGFIPGLIAAMTKKGTVGGAAKGAMSIFGGS